MGLYNTVKSYHADNHCIPHVSDHKVNLAVAGLLASTKRDSLHELKLTNNSWRCWLSCRPQHLSFKYLQRWYSSFKSPFTWSLFCTYLFISLSLISEKHHQNPTLSVYSVANFSLYCAGVSTQPAQERPLRSWHLTAWHSLQHVTSGTGEPWDKRPGRNLESEREPEKGLRESPIFLSMVFIKASSLIASVKVTGSFMSTWRVPALVCVTKQW